MNFHWPLFHKPKPEPVKTVTRYVAATKRDNIAAQAKKAATTAKLREELKARGR